MDASEVGSGKRWLGPVLEAIVAFVAMAAFLVLAGNIRVDPMQRVGQISGIAALQLRFMMIAVPLIAVLVITARRREAQFANTGRLVCAAFAGLASAFVAGGVIVALRNTPYCLNAKSGDAEMLGIWANGIRAHNPADYPPPLYPPMFPNILRYYMDLVDLPALYALKHLQIAVTALVGPLAYLCWRLVLRPGWALAIGVVASLIVIEPYKPYENIVLVLLVPVLIRFLSTIRRADERTIQQLAKAGVGFGIAFGLLCLTYSGWFRWSAPGVLVAGACIFPWRGGRWKSGALIVVVSLIAFTGITYSYLTQVKPVVAHSATSGTNAPLIQDDYIYFDVLVDPSYFPMWKGDMPGTTAPTDWPPPGELAGVGLYSVLLFAGFGALVALARKRTAVITIGCLVTGTWLMRMWYAHRLYETHYVQLFPRTSVQLAYLFVIATGYAVYYAVELVARRSTASVLRTPSALIGALCGLAFVIATADSAIVNRYMPLNSLPRTPGFLAYTAHDLYRQHIPPDPP